MSIANNNKKILDAHTHILPGIDDGSRNVEMSIEMLRAEHDLGVTDIILTPHFYADMQSPDSFLRHRSNAWNKLLQEMKKYEGEQEFPDLMLGAEVHYFSGMGNSTEVKKLCILGTNILLLEMPFYPWQTSVFEDIRNLIRLQGIHPMIAHLDRYIDLSKSKMLFEKLMELDVYIQLNTESMKERKSFKWACEMLKQGKIDFLGSDCHNMSSRPPFWQEAVDKYNKKVGEKEMESVFADSFLKIVTGIRQTELLKIDD